MDYDKLYTNEEILSLSQEDRANLFDYLLRSTGRENIENLITWLHNTTDFYAAPASCVKNSNFKGGLLIHSLITYYTSMSVCQSMAMVNKSFSSIPLQSIKISSLLHDVCMVCCYTEAEKRKMINGEWYTVESYDYYDTFPCGHGEKSVIFIMLQGVMLSRDELLAIRWHAGNVDLTPLERKSFDTALTSCPLMRITINAVEISSSCHEKIVDAVIKKQ